MWPMTTEKARRILADGTDQARSKRTAGGCCRMHDPALRLIGVDNPAPARFRRAEQERMEPVRR
jgi:hypothetical protein